MARLSNGLMGLINIVTLLMSVVVIGGGLWLRFKDGGSVCERFIQNPVIGLGVFLLLLSIAGLIGSCCDVRWLLWFYAIFIIFLIIAVFVFTIFLYLITNKGAGQLVSNRGFKEFKLADFSTWLQKRIEDPSNWRKIQSCLRHSFVCDSMQEYEDMALDDFSQQQLSPIESGCCKPPLDCNFDYIGATNWTRTAYTKKSGDCNKWSNDYNKLCYRCSSCRAGVLALIRNSSRRIASLNMICVIVLMCLCFVVCCARKNAYNKYRNIH